MKPPKSLEKSFIEEYLYYLIMQHGDKWYYYTLTKQREEVKHRITEPQSRGEKEYEINK